MRGLSIDIRMAANALLVAIPALILAAAALWYSPWSGEVKWLSAIGVTALCIWLAWRLSARISYPLGTAANLLEALRLGDYSLRGTAKLQKGAVGALLSEMNALSSTLRDERLRAQEADALLSKVLTEIEVVVMAFDETGVLRLANRAALTLLARDATIIGHATASELQLTELLAGPAECVEQIRFAARSGRFEVHRRVFRESGKQHQLLVLTDLTSALRDEERGAWQRLIRVLGHELNNSLAPIKSMAETLSRMAAREIKAADWQTDLHDGLAVISDRAASLTRFMSAYASLAKLPPPKKVPTALHALLGRVVRLQNNEHLQLEAPPELTLDADADQLEQALINLIKNALEASAAGGNQRVIVRLNRTASSAVIEVIDDGQGLANTENLFVPFFTTKPGGSGIGLVLARQIAEAHGGGLTLQNRSDAPGCVAALTLAN
jgi:two-component system, NtrC family, nitrogen regulation sensor histidine kinase NtrY